LFLLLQLNKNIIITTIMILNIIKLKIRNLSIETIIMINNIDHIIKIIQIIRSHKEEILIKNQEDYLKQKTNSWYNQHHTNNLLDL